MLWLMKTPGVQGQPCLPCLSPPSSGRDGSGACVSAQSGPRPPRRQMSAVITIFPTCNCLPPDLFTTKSSQELKLRAHIFSVSANRTFAYTKEDVKAQQVFGQGWLNRYHFIQIVKVMVQAILHWNHSCFGKLEALSDGGNLTMRRGLSERKSNSEKGLREQ